MSTRWCAALVALALVPRAAAADKLDDAYAKTDKAWKHYDELRQRYDVTRKKWDIVWAPIYAEQTRVDNAKRAMDAGCAGSGHGTRACSDATLAWVAEVKKQYGLREDAEKADPKHELDATALSLLNVDLQKAKTDFDSSFTTTKKLFDDARAHAHSRADLDKIDAKLAQRDDKQASKFVEQRGSKADAAMPRGGGGGNNSSSGGSSGSSTFDPTGIVNSTTSRW